MERSDEEQDQVEKEEAAFEIFIPCRLMALSAVDQTELGKARREEGGRRRKFSCEWVLWRGRGQNIFWKEATKGHYSDDDDDERQKRRGKKFYIGT